VYRSECSSVWQIALIGGLCKLAGRRDLEDDRYSRPSARLRNCAAHLLASGTVECAVTRAGIDDPVARRPYWTAYSQPEGDTEPTDPLAFNMYAERLGNEIVPGVTNRTLRVRYLGMVCAGLELTRGAASEAMSSHAVRERRRAFLPFERGWALAMTIGSGGKIKEVAPGSNRPVLRRRYRGFRGANLAIAEWRRSIHERSLHPSDYRFLAAPGSQGGLGAYLVTLDYGGFVDRTTLTLRAPGRELACAFLGEWRRKAGGLHADRHIRRGDLGLVGQALDLGLGNAAERKLVQQGLFADRRTLADACRRLTDATNPGLSSEDALRHLAESDVDRLARAAQFALDFDPMRRLGLAVFASLGNELSTSSGPKSFGQLAPETAEKVLRLQVAGRRLANRRSPSSVVKLGLLAQRLTEAANEPEIMSELLRWHAEHRTSWIVEVRPEVYELRRHGSFQEPGDFHGYTVGSALAMRAEAMVGVS
jgi:hypothetical protein